MWLLTFTVFAFTDSLLKRTEGGLCQSAHFWWDPYRQSLRGGWWVLPVFGRRWGQGLHPAGPPAEEPYQTTPQTRGHRQRWGGGGRRGPADLCSSEQQPQDHLRVSGARRLLKWRRRLSALTVEERVIQQTISEETPELEERNASSSSFHILRITRGFSFVYLPFAVFLLLLFWGGVCEGSQKLSLNLSRGSNHVKRLRVYWATETWQRGGEGRSQSVTPDRFF